MLIKIKGETINTKEVDLDCFPAVMCVKNANIEYSIERKKMNSFLKYTCVASVIAIVTGCGGSGGDDGSTSVGGGTPSNGITYQAVASEGELVSYSVDKAALTYSYRIIESAYDLTGATGSGQLTLNSDGSYKPSGFEGKLVIQDSGLLLGAIYQDLNKDGVPEAIPVIGIANPINSLVEAVGVYNFISRQCDDSCRNYYGTVKVNTDGTWSSCVGANLSATNYTCQASASGGVTAMNAGRANLTLNGVIGGSMLIFKDATTGQKAILLDLNGKTNLGRGAIFAGSQSLPESVDGNWFTSFTNGSRSVVTVNGNSFTESGRLSDGRTYGPLASSFTRDLPWSGFATTVDGHVIMPSSSGLYAAFLDETGAMAIGIKR